MKLGKLVVVSSALFLAMNAYALGKGDGNELLASCEASIRFMDGVARNSDISHMTYCAGFLHAIVDVTAATNDRNLKTCTPEGITIGQAARVLVKWLKANPEQLHQPDTALAIIALQVAYPCPK